jgi:periplasmic protein CpxP/Spy
MKAGMRRGLMAGMVAAVAVGAWAQPLVVPPGRWWERPRVAAELALSEQQRRMLDAVALDHAKTMVDLKAEVEKAELDLRGAADGDPFDAKKVREAFAVLQQRRTRLEQERFELLIKVREVLTAEQWRRLAQLAQERLRRGGAAAEPGMPPRLERERPF